MSAGEVVLVAAVVLCAVAFAALAVALVRLRDTTSRLGEELSGLRAANAELAAVVAEANDGLDRFEAHFGSATAISETISRGGRTTSRMAYSPPAIKAAGLVAGTSRAARKLRSGS